MSVKFTSNFFSNARGITFLDGGGITWTFNQTTNSLTATGAGGAGIGTVTSVGLASTDLTLTGTNPVTTSGTITANLAAQAGVVASSYTYAALTVNSKGIITAISNGAQPVTSISSSNLTIGGTAAVPTVNLSTAQVTNIGLGGSALQTAAVADSLTGAGTGGSPLQLVGDALTPGNSFYYGTNAAGTRGWYASAVVPVSANPSASVGLSAVNGLATTWMRSDGAPALSQAIVPTWTGSHVFSGTSLGGSSALGVSNTIGGGVGGAWYMLNTSVAAPAPTKYFRIGSTGSFEVVNNAYSAIIFSLTDAGALSVISTLAATGSLGVNGATPPAQVTGFGTPVGAAVVANYNSGSSTALQDKQTIAQILAVLKAAGIIGN